MNARACELAVAYLTARLDMAPEPMWEDYTTALVIGMAAPLLINRYRWTAWEHGLDPRSLADVVRGHAVVLIGNPAPTEFWSTNKDVLAAIGDGMLAATEAPPPLPEGDKPLVLFGLGTGRDGTSYLATLLGHQPGVQCAHQLLHMAQHTLHKDPERSAAAHWHKLERHLAAPQRPVWGNVCLTNAWRVEGILPHLVAAGYDFPIVALDRADAERLASWIAATDAKKEVMFGSKPSPEETAAGFRLVPWSHSTRTSRGPPARTACAPASPPTARKWPTSPPPGRTSCGSFRSPTSTTRPPSTPSSTGSACPPPAAGSNC